jgi:predicted ATPase
MYYLSRDAQTMAIPSRIHDVIMARVDCLSQDAKKILQIGSVIGREFDHNLLGCGSFRTTLSSSF